MRITDSELVAALRRLVKEAYGGLCDKKCLTHWRNGCKFFGARNGLLAAEAEARRAKEGT
jgi:hypothetical protein